MKKVLFVLMSLALIWGMMGCNKENSETDPLQKKDVSFNSVDEEGDEVTPSISQKEIPITVAYANWTENGMVLESDKNCLNIDKYIFSDYPRLPVFKFDTKEQLDAFKNKYKDTFTMDHGYDEIPSFNDVTNQYDNEFFENHSLMLTYKAANTGSYRYTISEVRKEKGTLILRITNLNNPEVYTDDMAGWFLMAEVLKEYIADCKSFDAQLVKDFSGNVVTMENNIIKITNGKNDYDSINVARIEKFVENSKNGIDDEIEVTQYTIEGDPIITTVRYNENNETFEIIMDTTQDKFGVPEIIEKEYDNCFQAVLERKILVNDGVERSYYAFQLVSEEEIVDICTFHF